MPNLKRILSNLLGTSQVRDASDGDTYVWEVTLSDGNLAVGKMKIVEGTLIFTVSEKVDVHKFKGDIESLLRFTVESSGNVTATAGTLIRGFETDRIGLVSIFYNIVNPFDYTKLEATDA